MISYAIWYFSFLRKFVAIEFSGISRKSSPQNERRDTLDYCEVSPNHSKNSPNHNKTFLKRGRISLDYSEVSLIPAEFHLITAETF